MISKSLEKLTHPSFRTTSNTEVVESSVQTFFLGKSPGWNLHCFISAFFVTMWNHFKQIEINVQNKQSWSKKPNNQGTCVFWGLDLWSVNPKLWTRSYFSVRGPLDIFKSSILKDLVLEPGLWIELVGEICRANFLFEHCRFPVVHLNWFHLFTSNKCRLIYI